MQTTPQEQTGNSYTAAQERERQQDSDPFAELAADVGVDIGQMLLRDSVMPDTAREGNVIGWFIGSVFHAAA